MLGSLSLTCLFCYPKKDRYTMGILVVAGSAILFGTLIGKLFQKYKLPQVVGYIIFGVLIGKSVLHWFEGDIVESLRPLVNFTLGIIGCVIGAELKGDVFRKYGRSIYAVLIGEGVLAFLFVTVFVTLLTQKLYLGIILGAIAAATDPASTISVLWEYKARGPMTRTLTSIIALDDALALFIYGLSIIFAKSMIMHGHFSLFEGLVVPVWEIIACLILGASVAVFVVKVIKYIKEETLLLAFVLGVIAATVGLAVYWQLDLILASMAVGTTMANMVPKISEKIFGSIKDMATSLYILFFVSIGAQLDVNIFLKTSMIGIVLVYILSRSAGKVLGAMGGCMLTKMKKEVTDNIGYCLFTQGGVAIGLALSVSQNLAHLGPEAKQVGLLIINVVAATTFIVQIIGPPLVKMGITRSDEIGRDVTKEDIVESLNVSDVMRTDFRVISEGIKLDDIIRIVKEEDGFNYPVVNSHSQLIGTVTMRELKDALLQEDLSDIILAEDIAVPARYVLYPGQPLKDAFEIFNQRNLDFIPVLEDKDSRRVVGLIEYNAIQEQVNLRLLERTRSGDDKILGAAV